ncbi:IS3 family transposase [Roseivirga spongicola]|uniref:IS3 family transposase n=1 Tax=Roseivirga spongicola TaxID=333140 RepID=UPI002AC95B5F|nr:IS3 family transposase [Roseivirga spongicola]WPZ12211.1 IS3 family transposase [Roseivirga spongicola]
MSHSLNQLYRALGTSRQSVHQSRQRQALFDKELEMLIKEADLLKSEHPGCGVEKMYYTLQPKTMGRDKFCEIFLSLGYGVKKVKNYRRTTFPGHIRHPNLIEGMEVSRPFQVVQSDITYFDLNGRFHYLVFIIDVYTREVLGHQVSHHMRAEANLKALDIALKKMAFRPGGLIHHSDRGSQYGSDLYTRKLKKKGVHISMGLTATDNAYAERVNGIIKNEYLKLWNIGNEQDLRHKTARAVKHYNQRRKHRAFNMKFSPAEFYQNWLTLSTQDRPKVIIYTEGKPNLKGASSPNEIYPRTEPQAYICPME